MGVISKPNQSLRSLSKTSVEQRVAERELPDRGMLNVEDRDEVGVAAPEETSVYPVVPRRLKGNPFLAVRPGMETPSGSANTAILESDASMEGRVNIHVRISKHHHARLKIHAFRIHQSMMKLIESWIEIYCPDV